MPVKGVALCLLRRLLPWIDDPLPGYMSDAALQRTTEGQRYVGRMWWHLSEEEMRDRLVGVSLWTDGRTVVMLDQGRPTPPPDVDLYNWYYGAIMPQLAREEQGGLLLTHTLPCSLSIQPSRPSLKTEKVATGYEEITAQLKLIGM